ncbi:hypothetical protein H6F73_21530 [Microcoleus sp. FACHB-68]|nr:hypothetical protein [Microcoleus sp. FACHB-68]
MRGITGNIEQFALSRWTFTVSKHRHIFTEFLPVALNLLGKSRNSPGSNPHREHPTSL